MTLKIDANDPQTGLHGSREFVAGVRTPQQEPVISSASVVSAAGADSYAPVAPGSVLSIYGQRLTSGFTEFASANPLPDHLANSYVVMAGILMPLLYASPNQINAIVPSGVSINTSQQVLVARADAYSTPVLADLAASQPAFFNIDGYAIAQGFRGDRAFTVSIADPVASGDKVVLYCAGLGLVNPALPDGTVTPLSPTSQTRSQVTLSIGGKDASVSFAGLTPGFVGLYQVNAIVPADIGPGSSVAVVVSVAGQSSQPAFLRYRPQ